MYFQTKIISLKIDQNLLCGNCIANEVLLSKMVLFIAELI